MFPIVSKQLITRTFQPFQYQMKYCSLAITKKKKNPKLSTRYTTPKLEKEYIEIIKSVTGFHIGSTGISWALLHLEENKSYIKEWNNYVFPENLQKLQINELCNLIFDVKKSLPVSDIYVTESISTIMRTNNPLQHGIVEIITQLQSMLYVALNYKNFQQNNYESSGIDNPKLIFLKNKLTSRLFNLLIKSETISSKHIIENLIDLQEYYTNDNIENSNFTNDNEGLHKSDIYKDNNIINLLNNFTPIILNEDSIRNYDHNFGYYKESMAIGLLHSITFSDLILRKNIKLLNKLISPNNNN